MLDLIVLGLLRDESLTGYDIKKRIEKGPGFFIKSSFGSLYPMLGRLSEKGEATVTQKVEGARVKKYYALTPKGQKRFDAWLRQPIDAREADNQRLAKIYFFDSLPEPQRTARLQEYIKALEAYLYELYVQREQLLLYSDGGNQHYFKMSTLYYGIGALEYTKRWCKCLAAAKPLESLLPPDREI